MEVRLSKFLQKKVNNVYHCIPVKAVGESILPSDNYGMKIHQSILDELGINNSQKIPLIFASSCKMKSMAFALQSKLQEKILNKSFNGTNGELVIACDRENMLSRIRDITIYEIPDDDFRVLTNAEKQCVSAKAIPFNNTKIVFKANSAKDLIREGLQIFSFNENFLELAEKGWIKKISDTADKDFYKILGEMVHSRILFWENLEHKININFQLAQKINLSSKFKSASPKMI